MQKPTSQLMTVYHLNALKNVCVHCVGSEVTEILDACCVHKLGALHTPSCNTMDNHMSAAPTSHPVENYKFCIVPRLFATPVKCPPFQ